MSRVELLQVSDLYYNDEEDIMNGTAYSCRLKYRSIFCEWLLDIAIYAAERL